MRSHDMRNKLVKFEFARELLTEYVAQTPTLKYSKLLRLQSIIHKNLKNL